MFEGINKNVQKEGGNPTGPWKRNPNTVFISSHSYSFFPPNGSEIYVRPTWIPQWHNNAHSSLIPSKILSELEIQRYFLYQDILSHLWSKTELTLTLKHPGHSHQSGARQGHPPLVIIFLLEFPARVVWGEIEERYDWKAGNRIMFCIWHDYLSTKYNRINWKMIGTGKRD